MTNGKFSTPSEVIIFSLFVLNLLLVWSHMVCGGGGGGGGLWKGSWAAGGVKEKEGKLNLRERLERDRILTPRFVCTGRPVCSGADWPVGENQFESNTRRFRPLFNSWRRMRSFGPLVGQKT